MIDNTPPTRRRRFIAALAATATFAGCSGQTDNPPATEQPATNNSPATPPDHMPLENDTASSEPTSEDEPELTVGWQINDSGQPQHVDDPDWRMQGNDTGNSFRNPYAEGPSSDPSIQWTVGSNISTLVSLNRHPVIADGTVYTCRAVNPPKTPGDDRTYQLTAIDADTGETEPVIKSDNIILRPCVTDETIYVAMGTEGKCALCACDRATGTEQWRTDGLVYEPFMITRVNDTVFITDGDPKMYLELGGDMEPESSDKGSPELFAVDAETGDLRWTAPGVGPNMMVNNGLCLATDTVALFGSTRIPRQLDDGTQAGGLSPLNENSNDRYGEALIDGVLLAIGSTEEEFVIAAHDWQTLERRWVRTFGGSIGGSNPVAVNGTVALLRPDKHSIVGLDFETGETRWEVSPEIPEDYGPLGVDFSASKNELYGTTESGWGVFAIDPADGEIIWELQTEAMNGLALGAGAVAGDLLVVPSGDKLLGIS